MFFSKPITPFVGSIQHKLSRVLFGVCVLASAAVVVNVVQGAGKRRWSIEDTLTSNEEELPRSVQDIDLRVLADFKEAQVRCFV